jgi:hypothetical protein
MFHVTMGHSRVITIVAVENEEVLNITSVGLFSCPSYPACISHLFYFILPVFAICGLYGPIIFFYSIS